MHYTSIILRHEWLAHSLAVSQVAMKALGFDEDKQEVLRILQRYGQAQPNNTRRFITYDAFAQIMAEKISARDPLEEIVRAFSLFAGTAVQSNNGEELRIGVEDLRRVAKELGENLEEEEIQAMIREFDLDNDNLSTLFPPFPPGSVSISILDEPFH